MASGVSLIELHGPTNQIIYVNPHEIASVREPLSVNQRHFAAGTRCIVVMANGNFIAVSNTCSDVRKLVETR